MGSAFLIDTGISTQVQKKKLGPAFSPRQIKALRPVFWNKSVELVTALSKTGGDCQGLINISSWASRAALDMISVATFGGDFNTIDNPDTDLSRAYTRLLMPKKAMKIRSTLALLLPTKILRAIPIERNEEIKTSNETIRHFCWRSIQRAKDRMMLQDRSGSGNILSTVLGSHGFDDDEMVDQLMTFLVAGHETIAQTFSWAVYFLCKHPHVQDGLHSELSAHLPAFMMDGRAESASLDEMPYLQAVRSETLRLKPVVPMLYRQGSGRYHHPRLLHTKRFRHCHVSLHHE